LCVQPNCPFFHLTKMINCCVNYPIIHVNTSNVFLLLCRIWVRFIADFISWCRFQIRWFDTSCMWVFITSNVYRT
jgi:hypothetical protein